MADASGVVHERSLKVEPEADLGTHHKINLALLRRGLAAELAGVMSFETHERLRGKLVAYFTEEPSDPRYVAPSLHQLRDADQVAWRLLGRACRNGIKPKGGDSALLVDAARDGVLESADFALKLLPMPALTGRKRAASGSSSEGKGRRRGPRKSKKDRRTGDDVKSLRAEIQRLKQDATKSKGNDDNYPSANTKGNGNNSKSTTRVPKALVPGTSRLPSGEYLCFGYNLGQCTAAPPGGKCAKGLHLCTRVGCHKEHTALSHPV